MGSEITLNARQVFSIAMAIIGVIIWTGVIIWNGLHAIAEAIKESARGK